MFYLVIICMFLNSGHYRFSHLLRYQEFQSCVSVFFFRSGFCYFQTCVQQQRRDKDTLSSPDLCTKCWRRCKIPEVSLRRHSDVHPSLAWSSANGLNHLWYAHPCTSASSFWSSFSCFCQALILWNTNAVFGKFKFNVSHFMVEGLYKISWLRFKHVYFFCASSPFG